MKRRQSCRLRAKTSLWLAVVACALPPGGFCRQIEHVQPVVWTRYGATTGIRSNDVFGQTLTTVLQNEARYELRWVAAEQKLVSNLPGWEGVECYSPRFDAYMLASAQAMMPHHPNVEKWRQKASEYQISAYSRQSDLTNGTLVDGKPAKDWLHGCNVFADGVLVNHNRVHPDYMLAQETCFASMVAVSLAGQYIPQSMVFNAGLAYRALTEVRFTPGTDTRYSTGKAIAAPGGTIYYRTTDGGYSGDIYYPQGSDWTTKVTDGYLNMDLAATQLGFDVGKPFSAMGWAMARAQSLLALQNRAGHDGNIYQPGDWTAKYRGTDEVIFQSNAQAWMQWWLMQNHMMSPVGDHWGPVRGGG